MTLTTISITRTPVSAERQAIVDYIKTALTTLFPENGVRVVACTIIGQQLIYVQYTHNRDASTCASNILENDPAFMKFTIGPERGTWIVEYPSTHCNKLMGRDKPLNFRKLRANTEQGVAEKLVVWFKKNQAIIATAGTL